MSTGSNDAASDASTTSGTDTDDECETQPKTVNDTDSSSSSSSSSSSESSSSTETKKNVASFWVPQRIPLTDQETIALKEQASKLEQDLVENPFVYETYTRLLDIYIRSDDWWPELHATFKKFHSQFPLTEHYWLLWLDQRQLHTYVEPDLESVLEVGALFDKAVEDYLSIDVWIEYGYFGIRCLPVEQTRKVFGRALNTASYHFNDGSKIWTQYKNFEVVNIQQCGYDMVRKRKLAEEVYELFEDRLKIPQKNLASVHSELIEFNEDMKFALNGEELVTGPRKVTIDENIQRLADEWQTFEDRLKDASNELDKFQIYKLYIETVTNETQYLLKSHKTRIIRCLHERLVADCCLLSYAWIMYLDYVQKPDAVKEPDRKSVVISIAERAVRNVPYDGSVWAYFLMLMDRFDYTHDQITERFETVLRTGLTDGSMYVDVWLAYIEHFCRVTSKHEPDSVEKLRKVFEQAFGFVQYYDSGCRVARLWAWAQAVYFDDLATMRQTFTSVLNSGANAQQVEFWLELAALERQFGDVKHERKTWLRAFDNVRDARDLVASRWLDFESKHGAAEHVLFCRSRINQL